MPSSAAMGLRTKEPRASQRRGADAERQRVVLEGVQILQPSVEPTHFTADEIRAVIVRQSKIDADL